MLNKIHQLLGLDRMRSDRLVAATVKGDTKKMAALLDAGVNIDAEGWTPRPESSGRTRESLSMAPLTAACRWGQPKATALLLERGASAGPRAMDEVIVGLGACRPWTQEANDARDVLVSFIKAGCCFKGSMGEGYLFAQSSPARRECIDCELRRLYPGESLDMAGLMARHAPASQERKAGI